MLLSQWLSFVYMIIIISVAEGYETVEGAAILARMLVNSSESVGTMATIYPETHPDLAGIPFSLQEYYASCHGNGSLTLLLMPISRHGRNILSSESHEASISITTARPDASRARVALMGSVTVYKDIKNVPNVGSISLCYLARHPDARRWLPGPREPHIAYWAIFDPHTVYYVGGFGSEHYIGYIPLGMYQSPDSSHANDRPNLVEQYAT
ncbi:pyridoxamine 5'-phosphate oxidase-domain-containing protein [Sparassis latifolia]